MSTSEATAAPTPGPWLLLLEPDLHGRADATLWMSEAEARDESERLSEWTGGNVASRVVPLSAAWFAPDLLAELERAVLFVDEETGNRREFLDAFFGDAARAAVAKAKGGGE